MKKKSNPCSSGSSERSFKKVLSFQKWVLLWSKSPHNPESFYSCGD
tara:strand:- start:5 stop:142 length:138 start_codon:yes stop_codon:yes gene_type:complete